VSVAFVPVTAPAIEAEPTEDENKLVALVGAPVTSILAEEVKLRLPPNEAFLEVKLNWLTVTAPVMLAFDKKLEPLVMVRFFDVPPSVTDPLI
jgi:hypothetical protein